MNTTVQPHLRNMAAMMGALGVVLFLLFSVTMVAAKLIASPDDVVAAIPLIPMFLVILGIAIGLPIEGFILALPIYIFERRKRWIITPAGVEMWRGTNLLRSLSWDDIVSVRLSMYMARLESRTNPRFHELMFISRAAIMPHVPEEKLQLVQAL